VTSRSSCKERVNWGLADDRTITGPRQAQRESRHLRTNSFDALFR
jgi:hypothetical protein